jgi:excisionase family DNA binding protein
MMQRRLMMHQLKSTPIRVTRATGADESQEPVGLLNDLVAALNTLFAPLKADLEYIRATLSARRKDFFTVEEVARLTGRSAYTIRRWITEQRLKAIRVSGTGPRGRLLVPRAELEVLIAAGLGDDIPEATLD